MSLRPLSQTDLDSFAARLSKSPEGITEHFSLLHTLYQRLNVNAERLSQFEYGTEMLRLEHEYAIKKENFNDQHLTLKKLFKQIDNRIIAAEQKLSRGIPEDLNVMERLISEQESIVADQEKLNDAETALIEEVRKIDVDYGKQIQKLEQDQQHRKLPLSSTTESNHLQIDQHEKNIKLKSKLISILPILGIPLLIDIIFSSFGLSVIGKSHQTILAHYAFLIAFILCEFFLGDKVRIKISAWLSKDYFSTALTKIQTEFDILNNSIRKLESAYEVRMEEVLAALDPES